MMISPDKKTKAGKKQPSPSKPSDFQVKSNLKIFLGCLPKKISEVDIREIFSTYGEISKFEFEIQKQGNEKSHLINGIFTCSSHQMKEQILKETHFFNKVKLRVSNYLEKEELERQKLSLKRRRVYIRKLPEWFENETLHSIFSIYGELEDAYCTVGSRSRKNLKYGYVLFKDENDIAKIPANGMIYRGLKIDWETFFTRKEKQKRKKERGELEAGISWEGVGRHYLKPGLSHYHLLYGEIWYQNPDLSFQSLRINQFGVHQGGFVKY